MHSLLSLNTDLSTVAQVVEQMPSCVSCQSIEYRRMIPDSACDAILYQHKKIEN